MIGLLLAITLQTAAPVEAPAPARMASDPCVELQGRGRATIGDERFSGRSLTRAVARRIPPGRPLFIRFANERASSDIEGMAAVMAGAINAPSIAIVETCEVPVEGDAQ